MTNLSKRKFINWLIFLICGIMTIVAIIPLISILIQVTARGAAAINLDFFTKLPPSPGKEGGGLGNAIVGTIYLVSLASLFSIPVGIMAGIFLAEFGQNKLSYVVRLISDVLSGIPSIVVGIFTYIILVRTFGGYSALAGGAALAIIMVPLIVRTTEEMLLMVPDSLREASLALGANTGETIFKVVLPSAYRGIITGIMLSLSRAAGETAPLLFTALNSRYWPGSLFSSTASLPVYIFNYAISPYDNWQNLAWGAAFILIMMVLITNAVTRYFSSRQQY
ncbi:MAG: phosphate ABC transporter permease PstA [Halanaerobiales bacterium]